MGQVRKSEEKLHLDVIIGVCEAGSENTGETESELVDSVDIVKTSNAKYNSQECLLVTFCRPATGGRKLSLTSSQGLDDREEEQWLGAQREKARKRAKLKLTTL